MSATLLGAVPAVATETITYSYDAHDRLTTASHSGTVNAGLLQSYSFDDADNRSRIVVQNSPFNHPPFHIIAVPIAGISIIALPTDQ